MFFEPGALDLTTFIYAERNQDMKFEVYWVQGHPKVRGIAFIFLKISRNFQENIFNLLKDFYSKCISRNIFLKIF